MTESKDTGSAAAKVIAAKAERDAAVASGEDHVGETAGELLKKADQIEAKTVPGAPVLTPKADLLDARAYEEAHSEKYVRYGSTRTKDKVQQRRAEGFEAVSQKAADEAGVNAEVGSLRLMEVPREVHDARVERQEKENERRLVAHRTDVERAAESIVKQMRDRHGLDVKVEDFLVNE